MKLSAQQVRLKEFQLNDKRRQLQQLRATVSEFRRIAGDLEKQVSIEEIKVGIYDTNHFAYPILARSARQRANNLLISIRELLLLQEMLESSLEQVESTEKK